MQFSKIYISSDFISTCELEQSSNLRWLFDILEAPVRRGTSHQPVALESLTGNAPGTFCRETFFAKSFIGLQHHDIHFHYSPEAIHEESIQYLISCIGSGNLIIGYELSEATRAVIARSGNFYVDVWLHPVRFYEDAIFGLGSNNGDIAATLKSYEVPKEQIELYAQRIRVQAYRGWERNEIHIPENSALFVSQMDNDKSVCQDGRFLSLVDYEDEFRDLCEQYKTVFFSEHPYKRQSNSEVLDILASIPNVKSIDESSYKIISHPNLENVITLSSSVAIEAGYFGKRTTTLFKPPFPVDDYAAICQSFLSPAFWSKIAGVHSGAPATAFLSPKDKIRDMLGFYWSYGEIDKLEGMRSTRKRNQLDLKKPAARHASGNLKKVAFLNREEDFALMRAQIDDHEVISFDIFDTLLERTIGKPNDLFLMMGESFSKTHPVQPEKWAQTRANSRNLVGMNPDSEEAPLLDRHLAVADRLGYSAQLAEQLAFDEKQREMGLCKARPAGVKLFKYAKARGKKVVLISDIFFDNEFLAKLLKNAGITGYDALYSSNDTGLLKHSGSLYPYVLEQEEIDPSTMLHFGDNHHPDVKRANEHGINAIHLRSGRNLVSDKTHLFTHTAKIKDDIARSVIEGLATRRLTRKPGHLGPLGNGNFEDLGYIGLGPMFLGFALWLAQQARANGAERLFFLSRDGDIIKQCYDLVTANDPSAPKSEYILCSRRSSSVAAIHTEEDVLAMVETRFSPMQLAEILRKRFGVKSIDVSREDLQAAGFNSIRDMVNPDKNMDALRAFLKTPSVLNQILQNAELERGRLLAYYRSRGMDVDKPVHLVDIGHSGSLQRNISRAGSIPEVNGYYFTTFADIDKNRRQYVDRAFGYMGDRLDTADKSHPYMSNILMFETFFLNSDASFLHLDERMQPVFQANSVQYKNGMMSMELHRGAKQFISDVLSGFGEFTHHFAMPAAEATVLIQNILKHPSKLDAALFDGIEFENEYNGREKRYLIKKGTKIAIWKEGQKAVYGTPMKTKPKVVEISKKAEMKPSKQMVSRKEALEGMPFALKAIISTTAFVCSPFLTKDTERKLYLRPRAFYRDSRVSWARSLKDMF